MCESCVECCMIVTYYNKDPGTEEVLLKAQDLVNITAQ